MRGKVVGIVVLLMLYLGVPTVQGQSGSTREAARLNQQADQLYQQGHYVEATRLWQRALAIWEKVLGPEHPDTATALNNLAVVYAKMGDFAKALPLCQRALAIREKTLGPDHPDTAASLSNLAAVYNSMGDSAQALQLYAHGLAVQDKAFANVFAVISEDQKLQFVKQSQEIYLNALSIDWGHFETDASAVHLGLDLVLRRKGIVLDAQSRTQQTLAANLQGEALQSWQRLTQHRSELSSLLLGGPEKHSSSDYRSTIEDIQAAIAQEEEFLAQHSSVVAQELAQRKVTAQLVAERLPKGSALAEFVSVLDWDEKKKKRAGTYRYLAFILTPENQVTLVLLGEAKKIDTTINEALVAIDDPQFCNDLKGYTDRADAKLAELYDVLFRPLEPALGSAKRLIVSPDGELSKVPFAALRTPDGHYLIEQTAVSYVVSGRDLLRGASGESPIVDLLLVANPSFDDKDVLRKVSISEDAVRAGDYGERFDPLPGTAEEARIIPPLLTGKQQVLQGKEATESAVRSVKSPKVLHLATHGFFLKDEEITPPDPLVFASVFDSGQERGMGGIQAVASSAANGQPATKVNPLVRSGLALAGANHAKEITAGDDGILTALEVTGMNLYGTDLVVLSACETGLGDVQIGEGVYGLRWAFVLAGAKNLVMSLWTANDKITLNQMEEFYRGYSKGKSPAVALREAQLQTIANLREQTKATLGEALAPVRLWAPFIVQQTGEPKENTPTEDAPVPDLEVASAQPSATQEPPPPEIASTNKSKESPTPEAQPSFELASNSQTTPQVAPVSLAVPQQPWMPAYSWWNLGVLLFATIGLLVLSRVRLSVVPVEMAGGTIPVPAGVQQLGPYARLVRQSALATLPHEIAFIHDETLIGSGPECDVILHHPSIARQHARVQWRKQGYVLCAVPGTQSTFVNGRPIVENLLKDGWTVRLGEVEFIFYGAKPQG